MAETLVELVARISADATELKRALSESEASVKETGRQIEKEGKSIREQFKEIGKAATVMGVAITAAMTGIIMSFTKTGSELHDLSLKTGVSAKSLAGLKYAAEQSGASLGTIEMAIRRTAGAMQDAKDGLAETNRAFDRMGLSIEQLKGLNPEQQFMAIASAIANIPDPMTRAATAQDLFGRSGMDMLPMLSQGADGLRKMMEEGVKLSGWTVAGANQADVLGDSFTSLKTATSGLFVVIAQNLAPILTDVIERITGIIVIIRDWIKAHPELAKTLGIVAIAIGGVLTVVGALTLAMLALNPVAALVGVAISALVAAGILLWQNWDEVLHWLQDAWSNTRIAIITAIDAILAALQTLVFWIPSWSEAIGQARDVLAGMVQSEKIVKDIHDTELALKQLGKTTEEIATQGVKAFQNMATAVQSASEIMQQNVEIARGMAAGPLPENLRTLMKTARERGLDISELEYMLAQPVYSPAGAAGRIAKATRWIANLLERAAGGEGTAGAGPVPITPTGTYFENYQHGGIVERTGLAYLHEGGKVLPDNGGEFPIENLIELTINLDGEIITKNVMRRAGQLYLQRNRLGG